MAPLVAPSAERTASSRWRAVPRASRRLATLAQAISSRNPTAASSSHRPRVVFRLTKLLRNGSTLVLHPSRGEAPRAATADATAATFWLA